MRFAADRVNVAGLAGLRRDTPEVGEAQCVRCWRRQANGRDRLCESCREIQQDIAEAVERDTGERER